MKFVLFSIALVAFANGVLSSPSKVKLPSDELQDISNKGGEIYQRYLDWKTTLPEGSDDTFKTYLDWLKNNRQLRDFEAEDLESEKRGADSIHPHESRSSSSVNQSKLESRIEKEEEVAPVDERIFRIATKGIHLPRTIPPHRRTILPRWRVTPSPRRTIFQPLRTTPRPWRTIFSPKRKTPPPKRNTPPPKLNTPPPKKYTPPKWKIRPRRRT